MTGKRQPTYPFVELPLDEGHGDVFYQLCVGQQLLAGQHQPRSFGREPSLEVEADGCQPIPLTLLQFTCSLLLLCVH